MPPIDSNGARDDEPADLRSILAAAATEHEEGAERPAATDGVESPAGASTEPTERTEGETSRRRGADGKFAPKEKPEGVGTAETKPEDAAAFPKDGKDEAESPPTPEAVAAAVDAPVHWSGADKETFGALPTEAKKPFLDLYKRMESGFTPKLQKLAAIERDFQGIPELFAPYADILKGRNQTPAHVINAWAGVEKVLNDHKASVDGGGSGGRGAEIVANMIRNYGINPADVAHILTSAATAPGSVQQPSRVELPPEVVARLQRLESAEDERVTAAQQQRLDNAQQQIEAFANEKDGDGTLKHPFFADVNADMMALARVDKADGRTPSLADLYDRAVYANPQTRAKLLSLRQDVEAKRAAAERKAHAEAAKRAGTSVNGAPGAVQSQQAKPQNRSLRDTLMEAAETVEA